MSCTVYLPNGAVGNKCPLMPVKGVILTNKTFTLGAWSAALNFATWKAAVDTNLTMYPMNGLIDYEPTTDDPNVVTSGIGQKKMHTTRPAPSGRFTIDTNLCDFTEMLAELKGAHYGVIYYLEDGRFLVKLEPTTGVFKPFPATVTAFTKGLPTKEGNNNFMVDIFHRDIRDFDKAVLLEPAWDYADLISAVPAGLRMWVSTAFAADDVIVTVVDRCGDPHADLVGGDFEVLSSNQLDTPAITAAVEGADGVYTLTLQKGATPGSLSAGDYIEFRVKDGTGPYTYLSNRLTVVATA